MTDYEQMSWREGKAEVATLLDAARVEVYRAMDYVQRARNVMEGQSGRMEQVGNVLEKLQEAVVWIDMTKPGY